MLVIVRWGAVFLVAVLAAVGWMSTALAQDGDESDSMRVNVIVCVDPDCVDTVNIFTMEGASVTSLDAAGAVVDSCTVTVTGHPARSGQV